MAKPNSLTVLLPALMSAALATPAFADGDHDRARDLYAHGDIQRLGELVRRATAETPGDVVGIDLVDRNGTWVYRLDILGPDGHRRIVEMNASTDDDETHGSLAQ